MKIYAFVQNGEVVEIIQPAADAAGREINIKDRFCPDFVSSMVDISGLKTVPGLHWKYVDGVFFEPDPIPLGVDTTGQDGEANVEA